MDTFDKDLYKVVKFDNLLVREVTLGDMNAVEMFSMMLKNAKQDVQLNGRATKVPVISDKQKDALLNRLIECTLKEAGTFEEWQRGKEDIDIVFENAKMGYKEAISAAKDHLNESFKSRDLGLDKGGYFRYTEGGKQVRITIDEVDATLANVHDIYRDAVKKAEEAYAKATNDHRLLTAGHYGLQQGYGAQAGPLIAILKEEIGSYPIDDTSIPVANDADCAAMAEALRSRMGLNVPMDPIVSLTDVNGNPTESVQMIAVLYGAAVKGVTTHTYEIALEMMRSVRAGTINAGTRSSIGEGYLNNPIIGEIQHINKIILAGYDPKRWRAAFQKPLSGMVEGMLSVWEASNFKQLTLSQLYKLFVPPVGSGHAISISASESEKLMKKEKTSKDDVVIEFMQTYLKKAGDAEVTAVLDAATTEA